VRTAALHFRSQGRARETCERFADGFHACRCGRPPAVPRGIALPSSISRVTIDSSRGFTATFAASHQALRWLGPTAASTISRSSRKSARASGSSAVLRAASSSASVFSFSVRCAYSCGPFLNAPSHQSRSSPFPPPWCIGEQAWWLQLPCPQCVMRQQENVSCAVDARPHD
jgi:hypothetical protein